MNEKINFVFEVAKEAPDLNYTVKAGELFEAFQQANTEMLKDVKKIFKTGSLLLTEEQIEALVNSVVTRAIEALEEKEALTRKDDDRLVRQAEAAAMLDVHKSTLWHYQRRGLLTPLKQGGRTMYRLSEINELKKGGKAYE
jgi:hypothetical protein